MTELRSTPTFRTPRSRHRPPTDSVSPSEVERAARSRLSPLLAIATTLAVLSSPGCSFLLTEVDPEKSESWQGCHRSDDRRIGLILEVVRDDGAPTAMLTGCFGVGLGTASSRTFTLAGVAESVTELEMSDGATTYELTKDLRNPLDLGDDTVTITSTDQTAGPLPKCDVGEPLTCDELLSGSSP